MAAKFDIIVPLPVTEKRLKERGFNQSFIIAEEIGALTDKPLEYTSLCKIRETADQYSLSREERSRNIRGAFAVRNAGRVREKRILLVDDLFTTGNTAREASRILLKSKAKEVHLFTLARTPS
jgi:ComF family protein